MYRRIAPWLALWALALGAPGCGGGSWSFAVVGTERDRGADGTIQVERIEGGNRLVTATFQNMAPPGRHGDGMTVFIMWFRDSRGQSTKASVLEFDEGSRSARATATTPLTRFTVLVTVERSREVAEPSENVIFRQQVRTD